MTEFRVGVPRELTPDQVAGLALVGITHDHESGPTNYAGFNDLEAMLTYVRLEAQDEREARQKVGEALDLDPLRLASARMDR